MAVVSTRREARGSRITVAIALLAVATAAVVAAIVLRSPFVTGVAGVFAVAMAWTALRLAWSTVVLSRAEHAADRTELAQAYRNLFAERAVEHAEFVGSMATRLAQRDQAIEVLTSEVTKIEMRAVEAEASARSSRTRLASAHDQIAAMESLIVGRLGEGGAEAASSPGPSSGPAAKPPLRGDARPREEVVPEWAELEPDPVASLMAWEKHAAEQGAYTGRPGRHAAG